MESEKMTAFIDEKVVHDRVTTTAKATEAALEAWSKVVAINMDEMRPHIFKLLWQTYGQDNDTKM